MTNFYAYTHKKRIVSPHLSVKQQSLAQCQLQANGGKYFSLAGKIFPA